MSKPCPWCLDLSIPAHQVCKTTISEHKRAWIARQQLDSSRPNHQNIPNGIDFVDSDTQGREVDRESDEIDKSLTNLTESLIILPHQALLISMMNSWRQVMNIVSILSLIFDVH